MTLTVKHKFTSVKGDGSDSTLVRPSNWNDVHDMTMATQNVLGRMSASTGAVEEIPTTTYMAGLFNTASFAALAAVLGLPTTGDAKLTFKIAADSGWVFMNDGSIGDAASGATTLAHADCLALFTLFFANLTDANAPLQTSTGAATNRTAQGSAAIAWGNHCRMVLPKQIGRAIIGAGAGSGLTNRLLGSIGGAEVHSLSLAELINHDHGFAGSGNATGAATGTATGSATGTASGSATGSFSGSGSGSFSGSGGGSCSGTTDGENTDHAHYTSGTTGGIDRGIDHLHSFTTGTMNQNWAHGHGVSGGTKGGTTNVTLQAGGTYLGVAYAGDNNIAINASDINHSHGGTTNAADRSLDHLHSWGNWSGGRNVGHTHTFNGSSAVNVSGGVTVSSVSGGVSIPSISIGVSIPTHNWGVTIPSHNLSVAVSGTTYGANGAANAAHNNMQPFVAWNIMVKL